MSRCPGPKVSRAFPTKWWVPGVQEAEVDLVMSAVNYTTQIHLLRLFATSPVFLKAATLCDLLSSLAAIG
jgi:hypothetical protein